MFGLHGVLSTIYAIEKSEYDRLRAKERAREAEEKARHDYMCARSIDGECTRVEEPKQLIHE